MTTDATNSKPTSPSGQDRGPDGRWVAGNRAAKRHGLRANSKAELRGRNARVGRLLRRYKELRAAQGRPLAPAQLPIAKRFVELESICTDLHALIRQEPTNYRALESYFAATRTLALVAKDLGEVASSGRGGGDYSRALAEREFMNRVQAFLPEASNGR